MFQNDQTQIPGLWPRVKKSFESITDRCYSITLSLHCFDLTIKKEMESSLNLVTRDLSQKFTSNLSVLPFLISNRQQTINF